MYYVVELLAFLFSAWLSCTYFLRWMTAVVRAWPPQRTRLVRYTLGCLPVMALAIILLTLRFLASFDVVDDIIYVVFYVALGYAWIYAGTNMLHFFFDLSWRDDVIALNNKAALCAFSGGYIGLTLIYSGANIGDGPGWWCVIFAGGLGLAAWIALGIITDKRTGMFERVTVDRDLACGIRVGLYLMASGLILARASAGDWTSFGMTVVEFMAGWPVLPLAALCIVVERYLGGRIRAGASVLVGLVYLVYAISALWLLPPLASNPLYAAAVRLIC